MITGWRDVPELTLGFSCASDGSMALSGGFERRTKYLTLCGLPPERTVHAGLCHGTKIAVVDEGHGGKIVPETDGLITRSAGLGLAMTAADCLLVYVYDPKQSVIGLFHAGRRGLADGIVAEFISVWTGVTAHSLDSCRVGISPSICAEHYTVSEDDAAAFAKWPQALRKRGNDIHLDLRAVATRQLVTAGIHEQQILVDARCTFEDTSFYSYRRDHPATPQLQVGYIMRQESLPPH